MQHTRIQQVRMTGTGTSGSTTISEVDTSKVLIFWHVGFSSSPATFTPNEHTVRVYLASSTSVAWARNSADGGETVYVTAFIVELGDDATVWSGNSTLTSVSSLAVTFGGTVDLTEAFCTHSHETASSATGSEEGVPSQALVSSRFTSTTQITLQKQSTTGNATVSWWVVESATLSVQSGSLTVSSTSGNTTTISAVTLATTFLLGSHDSLEPSYINDEGAVYADLQNTTTVRGRVGFNPDSNTSSYRFFVVSDSAQAVQTFGSSVSNASSGNDSPSAVDLDNAVVIRTNTTGGCNTSSYQAGFADTRFLEMWFASTTSLSWRRGSAVSDTNLYRQAVELDPQVATWEVEGYQWVNDDGDEDESTFAAAQDTALTGLTKETNIRLRVLLNVTGDPGAVQITLREKLQGDDDSLKRTIE